MAKAKKTTALSPAQLAGLARAALDNAVAILADAQLLLDAGRWPRAYALAILASEEHGKFESCVIAGYYEADDTASWQKFWKNFGWHKPKLTQWAGTLIDQVYSPKPASANDEWRQVWNERHELVARGLAGKEAGFYVDFVEGVTTKPATNLSEQAAREAVSLAGHVIGPMAATFKGDLTKLVSPPAQLRSVFAAMLAARTAEEREHAVIAMVEVMQDLLPNVAAEFYWLRDAARDALARSQAGPGDLETRT